MSVANPLLCVTVTAATTAELRRQLRATMDTNVGVFRTGEGHKFEHLLESPVSVQVDRFDWYRRAGWSILVQGVAPTAAGMSNRSG